MGNKQRNKEAKLLFMRHWQQQYISLMMLREN